ncbi:MAG: PfkB family carbohydrate kinase [Pseudomonadota bacterium]
MTAFNVYAYGVVSSSTLYRIDGDFPGAEGYAEITDALPMTGGEATNSSIVLSRLGASVKLDGNWLGDNDGGKRTKRLLEGYGIDTSRLPLRENHTGVEEVVFAAGDTRTIFGTYVKLQRQASWNLPQDEDISNAQVVCLDPFFKEPAAHAARVAFGAGIPVVTVDCRYDNPILAHTAAVVIAESFIQEHYPGADLEDLFRRYQSKHRGLTIFTFGNKPAWFARPAQPIQRFTPFPVDAVDTSGGGDSFRAGIVYGFLHGWDDERMVAFASAVAAIVCTRFPGVIQAPALDEVESFMAAAGEANNV